MLVQLVLLELPWKMWRQSWYLQLKYVGAEGSAQPRRVIVDYEQGQNSRESEGDHRERDVPLKDMTRSQFHVHVRGETHSLEFVPGQLRYYLEIVLFCLGDFMYRGATSSHDIVPARCIS
jgi:hypothetical protein